MIYRDWLTEQKLTPSSIGKYYIALKGVLSAWGKDAGLFESSILDIYDKNTFASIIEEFKNIPIYLERNKVGKGMYYNALLWYYFYLQIYGHNPNDLQTINLVEDIKLKPTEKMNLISSRIGQGKFRKDLIDLWGKCSVSGFTSQSFLIASHIKPWSISDNYERLDKYNGLLLTPNLDRAFDSGLITFDQEGKIILSTKCQDLDLLGIHDRMSIFSFKKQQTYLDYHRSNIFKN